MRRLREGSTHCRPFKRPAHDQCPCPVVLGRREQIILLIGPVVVEPNDLLLCMETLLQLLGKLRNIPQPQSYLVADRVNG